MYLARHGCNNYTDVADDGQLDAEATHRAQSRRDNMASVSVALCDRRITVTIYIGCKEGTGK